MQKNHMFLKFLVTLIGLTFVAYAALPTMAADDYTPTVTEDEISVFLETSFSNAKIWAWNDKVAQFTTDRKSVGRERVC